LTVHINGAESPVINQRQRRLLPLTRSSGSQPGVVVLGVVVIAAAVSYEHAHGLIRAHGKYG
jgi:hypothetical protein